MEEMIDIYDAQGQALHLTVPRKGARMQEGQFMLYVLGLVQNLEGKYLITRRALDKAWAAGWWEVSGGAVLSGETPHQAVKREVGEEVGLDVSKLEPELLYRYHNVDLKRGDNYINYIYRFRLDFSSEEVTLQAEEAIDCALVSWEDIVALNEQGVFLHFERLRIALGK